MKITTLAFALVASISAYSDPCFDGVNVIRNYEAKNEIFNGYCAKAVVIDGESNTTSIQEPYINIGEDFNLSIRSSANKNRVCEAYGLGKYVRKSAKTVEKLSYIVRQAQISQYDMHKVISEITCKNK